VVCAHVSRHWVAIRTRTKGKIVSCPISAFDYDSS